MFKAHLTAPRFHTSFAALLLAACWAGLAAAQSAATSSDQWRAAGGTQSTGTPSTSASGADAAWTLPTGQSSNDETQLIDDASNPLRQNRKSRPTTAAREPRAFQAPTNAAPMNAAQPTINNNRTPNQQWNNSVQSATRPAHVATQAYVQPRVTPNRAQSANQRPAGSNYVHPTANSQSNANNNGDDFWHTINVAFQGQPTQKQPTQTKPTPKQYLPENLPMPGDGREEFQDPELRGPTGPDAWNQPMGGPYYQPYGQPGQGCDEAGCTRGNCANCGGPCCGDGCEPGCGCPCGSPCGGPCCGDGCEPGCGCPSGDCPKKEVFCIGPGDDESCHIVQLRWPKWQEVMVFGGVQGFKGPYDRDRDSGNFGFNEGINIGAKVPYAQLGYQLGYRATESQLNGDKDTDIDKSFLQNFFTAGLFHRQKEGLQFGVVYDAVIDERTHSQNFNQLRTEVSCIGCGCHEFGFDLTFGLNNHKFDDGNGDNLVFKASDQYVLFYRLHGCNGGEGRIYAGANNNSDGILGSDMLIPISDCLGVQGGFTYLIPNAKSGEEGASQEAWNIGLGLVWHFDGQARKCFDNCYRPMFNVADNGYLIVDQQDKN
jgi:hypothetical protein